MNIKKHIRISIQIALVLFALIIMAMPSFAAVFNMRADEATVIMPDGTIIPVWGFALDGGPVTVPGPFLVMPPGETTLTINLANDLAVPISIVIPGQYAALSPDTFMDAQGRQRVSSFTTVTPAGGMNSYTWTNLQPGTYIYHSGTHMNLQVHMGLYGGLKVDAPGGEAYPGIPYDNEVILFYSEIDRALHDPDALPAQPLNYKPDYFLINGQPYPNSSPLLDHPITEGEMVIIRLLNMGFKTHVPAFNEQYVSVIAEDGHLYPYPKNQYSVFLPAGKTMDVLWTAPDTEGYYPVYDRSNYLRNAEVAPGGMLTYLDLSGDTATYSISGTVSTAGGSPIAGVTMTLTGAAGATTTTSASGNYTFTGLINGGYVVTPDLAGYTFAPTSRSVAVSGANVTGQNFTGTPSGGGTYSISGTVSTAGGSPVAGATMTLTGDAGATTTTDGTGSYSFTNLLNGTYTVTPSFTVATFTPTSRTVTIADANVTTQDFTMITYSISGTVATDSGTPKAGVTMTLSGTAAATVMTDALGNYSFMNLLNGTYTITPSMTGQTFTPANRNVTLTDTNLTAQDFTINTYSISGSVMTPALGGPGSPIAGVTMTLTGAAGATTTTNASGNYTFAGLINGSYTVTPSRAGYAFTPTSRNVVVSGANVTGQNFTGTPSGGGGTTYSISGTVSTAGGSPIEGVTMTLTGAAGATTTTNASGNYTFAGLINGSYTVTPSRAGYAFTPTSRNVVVSGANVTGQNFTGTPSGGVTYSISGTVRTASFGSPGSPIAGVTMTLTGAAGATTTTNASGNYTFTGLANGMYTVTPSRAGYTFTPTSRNVTISGANVTGQNFTGR